MMEHLAFKYCIFFVEFIYILF